MQQPQTSVSVMTIKLSGEVTGNIDIKDITAKEKFCLSMIAEGQTPREIGFILAMTEELVEVHLKSIEYKLKASSRVEAIVIAMRHDIL